MRILDYVMAVLFAFSALVQFNDPDPWLWAGIYLLAALVCLLSARRNLWWPLASAVSIAALIWAWTIAPRVVGIVPFTDMFGAFEMKDIAIEESREMYGLIFVGIWTGIVAARTAFAKRDNSVRRSSQGT